jgi:hypothetical protein
MRRCFLSVLLLFALPLSAAISKVQQSLLANVSSSTTCVATLSSSTTSQNLLVVWATWTPGNTVSVTSVGDSVPANSFPIAVGPTLQANASPQISAQIFYAANITGHTGGDSVTVQFSGTATTASCAAVEYSGADLSYPLDSTTAGFSNSGGTGTALDSGFAAPTYGSQNNLLIFGAGTTDAGTLATGGGGTTFP